VNLRNLWMALGQLDELSFWEITRVISFWALWMKK
jgi:hypothetical protein